ncbi:MAG: DinB family protein [Candidatus Eisenbacteria bacterium]
MTVSLASPLVAELEAEAAATRRLLEAVPQDKLTWAPHPKSMTLGQLALHVAEIPGSISGFLEIDEFDVETTNFEAAQPDSHAAILEKLDGSLAAGRERLAALTDEAALSNWKLTKGGAELFSIPKIGLARNLLFNHLYHHRGQLTVYLRLLDVPVPVVYGRTADVNPFA